MPGARSVSRICCGAGITRLYRSPPCRHQMILRRSIRTRGSAKVWRAGIAFALQAAFLKAANIRLWAVGEITHQVRQVSQ